MSRHCKIWSSRNDRLQVRGRGRVFGPALRMGLSDITLQLIAFRVLSLLILAAVQGGIVAGVAVLLGDKGPGYDGRLSLWPSRHIDVPGAACLVLFGLGWSRPVAVDAQQFRGGVGAVIVVILAGFIGLLAMAALLNGLILPALTMLPLTAGLGVAAFLRAASSLAIWCALLSLIPIPPLTGGLLWRAFGIAIPQRAQWILAALLCLGVATGVVRQALGPAYAMVAMIIIGD
jgi:hypothetical protein